MQGNLQRTMKDDQIIIYQTEDGQTQIDVRMKNDTVWLTQKQIADLFGTKCPAITKHLKNIYASEKLDESSTCSILEHMGNERKQTYTTTYQTHRRQHACCPDTDDRRESNGGKRYNGKSCGEPY